MKFAALLFAASLALASSACTYTVLESEKDCLEVMPQTLAAEAPLIWPTPINVPTDSDPPLASGPLKTTLKQLADRSDYLHGNTVAKLGVASGIATLDASGNCAQYAKGSIVQSQYLEATLPRAADTTTSTAFVPLNGTSWINFAGLKAGDVIHATATFQHSSDAAIVESQVSLDIDEYGTGPAYTSPAQFYASNPSTDLMNSTVVGRWMVPADGDYRVRLLHRTSTATHTSTVGQYQMSAFVERP